MEHNMTWAVESNKMHERSWGSSGTRKGYLGQPPTSEKAARQEKPKQRSKSRWAGVSQANGGHARMTAEKAAAGSSRCRGLEVREKSREQRWQEGEGEARMEGMVRKLYFILWAVGQLWRALSRNLTWLHLTFKNLILACSMKTGLERTMVQTGWTTVAFEVIRPEIMMAWTQAVTAGTEKSG